MQPVIIWGLLLMLFVFCIGLLSAIKSRGRREHVPQVQAVVREQVQKSREGNPTEEDGLTTAMAGGGYGNVAGGSKVASQAAGR